MLEIIQQLGGVDTQAFLCLNHLHATFWDYFMYIYSGKFVWIPFYLSFLVVMFKNFPWKANVECLLLISLIILACDQTASGLLKPLVERMRPSNPDNPISPLVHVVNGYRGGRFGFPSSHAANTWGLAFFAMYLARRKQLTLFLSLWALLMCYSRIYLGVHYPGDVLVGTVIGFCMASLFYNIFQRVKGEHARIFKPTSGKLEYAPLPLITGSASILLILVASGIMTIIGYQFN